MSAYRKGINTLLPHHADRERYALASQLAVLQSCPLVIGRLLRKRGSTLLAAKVLVLSRLLHKSLLQGADTPPFVDTLKTQLGSLRRRLLVHIDRHFASSDTATDMLVEAMCAFSLATSSLPKDVLKHFLHVRREALLTRLAKSDRGHGHGKVTDALRVYVGTLQNTRALFPKRLAESLAGLKTQPLLRSSDVRGLVELNLDLRERWVADEVRNFTPWVRSEDLQKAEAESVLKDWARKAFDKFIDGLRVVLEGIEDLKELVQLRRELLETWLSVDSQSLGLGSSGVLDGLRSAMNSRLIQVIQRRVVRLDEVSAEINTVVKHWRPGVSDAHPSLWDSSMTGMDVSNGAAAFKQAILDWSHGRNETLLHILQKWNTWLRSMEEVGAVIEGLKHTKWDADLEADEDDDLGLDSKEALLNEDDPQELKDEFEKIVVEAMRVMEAQLQDCVKRFTLDENAQQALFILRLVRELRQRLPKHFRNDQFGLAVVPDAQRTVAESALHRPIRVFEREVEKTSRSRRVLTRALWEGTPELPVQPSVAVFKLLHGVVSAMAEAGSDIWSPEATDVLKQELRVGLSPLLVATVKPDSAEDKTSGLPVERQGSDGVVGYDDWSVQLFFDTVFLRNATETKSNSGDDDLSVLVEKICLDEESRNTVRKAAEAYWVKTSLLFGLLA